MVSDPAGERDDAATSSRSSTAGTEVPLGKPELEQILSRIGDAVFVFSVERTRDDLSFTFEWNNAAHRAITGMTIDEHGGLDPREFLGEEAGAEVAAHYRTCVERRDTIVYEESLQHQHGQIRWETKLTPVVEDDRVVRILGIARDITDRVARRKHLQVVDRVFRHNVRNVVNLLQMRGREIAAASAPPVADEATEIVAAAGDLLCTSEKARTITEVLIGESPVTAMRVDAIVDRTDRTVSERDHDAELSITALRPWTVRTSPRITEALLELVENAIDHNDRPAPAVDIVVSAAQETVDIAVADDGPGIPETERDILTDGQPPRELSHGTGLGTWMVYWIVHQSSGEILVADREPRGSVVTMRLPRSVGENRESGGTVQGRTGR